MFSNIHCVYFVLHGTCIVDCYFLSSFMLFADFVTLRTSRTPLSSISNIINAYYFIIVLFTILCRTHILLVLLLFVLPLELTTSPLYFYVVSLQYSSLAVSLIFLRSLFVDSRENMNQISFIHEWSAFVTNSKWYRDIKHLFLFETCFMYAVQLKPSTVKSAAQ